MQVPDRQAYVPLNVVQPTYAGKNTADRRPATFLGITQIEQEAMSAPRKRENGCRRPQMGLRLSMLPSALLGSYEPPPRPFG